MARPSGRSIRLNTGATAPRHRSGGDVSLQDIRGQARVWIDDVPERRRQSAAWSFIVEALSNYAAAHGEIMGKKLSVSPLSLALTYDLNMSDRDLACILGRAAACLPVDEASYQISATYTALLPQSLRSALGIYYTPPAITDRLLDMVEEAGIDWKTAIVLDPACGGGAFLLPIALRIRSALKRSRPKQVLAAMGRQLRGFEIDPFAAWMTQAWLEIAFAETAKAADQLFPTVVTVCDSLDQVDTKERYDLVIGNPPYGRVSLSSEQRTHYRRSLYGHANLYGVFTDLALRLTSSGGSIAYVTPTSFLAGEYFKALRALLAREAPPLAIDFISARRGVFEDVLQETSLATYRRNGRRRTVKVHYVTVSSETKAKVGHAGNFKLPRCGEAPWIVPRQPEHNELTDCLSFMRTRLANWGYAVSTGPLVWNRHKRQLRKLPDKATYPLIWAEAVTSTGQFVFRADKRNHAPFFHAKAGDEWLQVSVPCVLVQRTTAKEQSRRLIAAELSAEFIAAHGRVVVENHLNMVRPLNGKPKVPPALVAAVLNSKIVDQAFRCISGSVAVSAFELEALPLPPLSATRRLIKLMADGNNSTAFERALESLYLQRKKA